MNIRSKIAKLIKGNDNVKSNEKSTTRFVISDAKSDIGNVRECNEDNYYHNTESGLFIVADGVGGSKGGEKASQIAVDELRANLEKKIEVNSKADDDIIENLKSATEFANKQIIKAAEKDKEKYEGMGTTVVLSYILPYNSNRFYVMNIGDSRAYLIEGGNLEASEKGKITQLTEDHSLAAEMERRGHITKEEARIHKLKHTIYHSLGKNSEIDFQIPIKSYEWKKNDYLLLCSDGLTDMVEDEEILSTILKHRYDNNSKQSSREEITTEQAEKDVKENTDNGDLKEQRGTGNDIKMVEKTMECNENNDDSLKMVCQELVQKAKDKGGRDNITLILIQNKRKDDKKQRSDLV